MAIESAIDSAATTNIGALSTRRVLINGVTTITSFGTSINRTREVRFAGALTLTHNGTTLQLPTSANILTAAGDTCVAKSDGSGNWIVYDFERKTGTPLVAGLPTHAVGALPSAAGEKRMIYVSDETGGAVPAFNDGTNWRRVTDRAICS